MHCMNGGVSSVSQTYTIGKMTYSCLDSDVWRTALTMHMHSTLSAVQTLLTNAPETQLHSDWLAVSMGADLLVWQGVAWLTGMPSWA